MKVVGCTHVLTDSILGPRTGSDRSRVFRTGERPASDPPRKEAVAVSVRKTMHFIDSDQSIDIRDGKAFMKDYALVDSFTELNDRVLPRG